MSALGSLISGIIHGLAGTATSGMTAAMGPTDIKTQDAAKCVFDPERPHPPFGPGPKGDGIQTACVGFTHPIHVEPPHPPITNPNDRTWV
jgi:hypothetical protein